MANNRLLPAWLIVAAIAVCLAAPPSMAEECLWQVRVGDKWGFENCNTKKTVIEAKFDHVCTSAGSIGGLIPVGLNGKWGYVAPYGSLIIEPQFEFGRSFSEGLAEINVGGKLSASGDSNGEVCGIEGGKWGYIDKTGEVVIQPQFDETSRFSEGLAAVAMLDKWGYIDKTGKIVIAPFDRAGTFSEGFASVKIGSQWGFVNDKGKVVITPQFDKVEDFNEGLAAVNTGGKWGFVDKTGEMVIKPQFDWTMGGFFRGITWVQNRGEKGFVIDRTGDNIGNWKFFSKDTDNTFYYFDPKQVMHPSKNVTRAWIKGLDEKNGKDLFLWEVDCSAKKGHSVSWIRYDVHGKVVWSDSSVGNWGYVAPGSMGEAYYDLLCHPKPKPTRSSGNKQRSTP
jgi:hypothetical protein